MKNKLLNKVVLAASLVVPSLAMAQPDPNFHIYLMLGQSNMEGSAPIQQQDRQSHPRVQVLQSENCGGGTAYGQWREATPPLIRCGGGGGLGPGDTFGDTIAENTPESITVGLVGGAYGGAKIEFFLPNCQQYNECTPPYGAISGAPSGGGYAWVLDLAQKAQEVGVIKGIIFHQGESNSGQSTWLGRVNEYVTALRSDLGLNADEVPFIAGELPYTGCCSGHNSLVRQIPQAVENGHWVPADGGLGDKGDSLHWDSAAVREMGRRYANKMLELVDVSDDPLNCGTEDGSPVCCNISADPDGDGWGTQNDGESCIVTRDTRGYVPPNPDDVLAAINVGSTQGASFGDIYYEADRDFVGGEGGVTSDAVSDADGSAVFTSERYGEFTYEIPITNQRVSVELNFVEMYWTAAGSRSFNVSIEGQSVINGLDLYSIVGHDALYTPDAFEVNVSDSSLTIDVETVEDNGTLSGILVRSIGGGTPSSSSSSSAVSSSSSVSSEPPASSSSSSSSNGGTTGGSLGWLMLLMMGGVAALRRQR